MFNPQDTAGDKAYKIMGHLVEAQMPFSLNQLKRLDQSIESVDVLQKGKFDTVFVSRKRNKGEGGILKPPRK